MRIVALVPGGISDQILFFPTLDDLTQNYPEAEIDVVVEPKSVGAYRVCKSVKDVFAYDFTDRNSLADWGNILGTIRDREYDIAISSNQTWLAGLLLWLTGIPKRIGYRSQGQLFLTTSVPQKSEQYTAAMYHDLLQGLSITSACPPVAINVPKQDIQWVETEQKRLGISDSGYLLIQIGQGENSYPIENWRQIIQDFQQRQPSLPVVLILDANSQLVVSQLLQSFPDLKVTAPEDLGKLAAMIAGSSLLLCTDSAAMQLGVGVQTYLIALFGATDPKKVLPESDRILVIKSPSGKLADISPNTILEKVWAG
ncbi:glycosyltransferase family 9 protein [Phormidium sp. LEGE 05292]|uniref:glycosyltransferase family 9 protein n=1 Tax=[Phormidium] sp. LEGE 05292 TaxID=767427 RepID=UPI0018811BE0|nr:glycosyltransferase family 9 protein [Phormidium sp. LEGE 05292]MBE9229366.1 glycosyltransferase family 9 protein [Phormidium sp. LEGE 05292]